MTEGTHEQADALLTGKGFEFTRGYLIAVSNLMGLHGSEVEARDLLVELGKAPDLSLFDFTEYDLENLAPLFAEMQRRDALRAIKLAKEQQA